MITMVNGLIEYVRQNPQAFGVQFLTTVFVVWYMTAAIRERKERKQMRGDE